MSQADAVNLNFRFFIVLLDFQGKSANLKPALKKQSKVKKVVRSVAWADQNKFNAAPDIGKTESIDTASSTNADETPNFEKVRANLILVP